MSSGLRLVSASEMSIASEELLPEQNFLAPRCLFHTNFDRLNPGFFERHKQNVYIEKEHHLNSVRLCKLSRQTIVVMIDTDDAMPIMDKAVLQEQFPPYFEASDVNTLVPTDRAASRIASETILIARFGIRTWGHWLGELLPKIVVAEHHFPNRYKYALPLFFRDDAYMQPMRESLEYYGIDKERIVYLAKDGAFQFDELFWVGSVWTNGKIHPGAAALMRKGRDKHRLSRTPSRIALLRTESTSRTLANLSDLVPLLTNAGFTPVEIGRLPFAQQVEHFSNAAQVVGVLGSGLTGLMYSPDHVEVMTLAPGNWGDSFFYAMMQERNARFIDIRGRQDPTDTRATMFARFIVAANDLADGLAHLTSPSAERPEEGFGRSPPVADIPPQVFRVLVHMQDIGDKTFATNDWIGSGGTKSIEGLTIHPLPGMQPADLRYRAVLRDGSLSEWCEGGEYCGSRGLHEPLRGLCFELLGNAAAAFECSYAASFADDVTVGPVRQSEVCRSPRLARMLAFRLALRRRAEIPGAALARRHRQWNAPPTLHGPSAPLPRPANPRLTVSSTYDAKVLTVFANKTQSAMICLPCAATMIRFVFGNGSDAPFSLKAYWAPTAEIGNGWSPSRADKTIDATLFAPITFNGAGEDFSPEDPQDGNERVAVIPPFTPAYFSDWMPASGGLAQEDAGPAAKFVLVRTRAVGGAGSGLRASAGLHFDGAAAGGVSAIFSSDAAIEELADTNFAADAHTHLLAVQVQSRVPGYSVLYAGSSIMTGTATSPLGRQCFTRVACKTMTAAGIPFTAIYTDVQADPRSSVIAASAIAKVETLRPDFVLMQVSNRNDAPLTFATQDETWDAAMRVADATIRHGGTPILVTGTPWPPKTAPDAATDAVRHLNNDRARASDFQVFDYDALMTDGGSPARISTKYNESGDQAHPDNAGHAYAGERLAALFSGLIASPHGRAVSSDAAPVGQDPGPSARTFMEALATVLKPASYFEIGANRGSLLSVFRCDAICVDPRVMAIDSIGSRRRMLLFQGTSREFFAENALRWFFPRGVDISFLAGAPDFKILLRDFISVERECHQSSLIVVDCLPPHGDGEVWRILPILKKYRPDVRVVYVDCSPAGLVVCGNLEAGSAKLANEYDRIVEEFVDVTLESFGAEALRKLYPTIDGASAIRQPDVLSKHFSLRPP